MNINVLSIVRGGVVAALFMALTPAVSEAQILRNITKRVTEKVEQEASRRVDRKIDQAVNKGFDKVEDAANQSMADKLNQMMGAMSEDVTLRSSYDFKIGVTYDMSNTDANGRQENLTEMTMWFSDEPYVGSEVSAGRQQTTSVIDDGQIIMFNDAEKTYMGISSRTMDAFSKAASDAGAQVEIGEESDVKVSMQRLADERILGFSCKVYEFTGDGVHSKLWYTEELDVNMFEAYAKSMGALNQYATSQVPKEARDFKGTLLKMQSVDPESGDTIVMEAKEVNRNGRTIQSSQYSRLGL